MNISNWPLNRIMQLPDNCFGQRYLMSCYIETDGTTKKWDISEMALPEVFVLWELNVLTTYMGSDLSFVRLALGDQLPTAVAQMDALEPLFPGFGVQGADPRVFRVSWASNLRFMKLRKAFRPSGRRLIMEAYSTADKLPVVQAGIVISSIPTEVPDWLCSGRV